MDDGSQKMINNKFINYSVSLDGCIKQQFKNKWLLKNYMANSCLASCLIALLKVPLENYYKDLKFDYKYIYECVKNKEYNKKPFLMNCKDAEKVLSKFKIGLCVYNINNKIIY